MSGRKIIEGLEAALRFTECDHEWLFFETPGGRDGWRLCRRCDCRLYAPEDDEMSRNADGEARP